jgi:acylphosphatase
MKTLHLRIHGRVQGVWFRESMRQEAERLGASGWVRNAPDGSVEATVQGSETAVDALVDWARRGPPQARVDRVEIESVETNGLFSGFEKRIG